MMSLLYADLSDAVRNCAEMPDEIKYVEIAAQLVDNQLCLPNGDVLLKSDLSADDGPVRLTKIDDRYVIEGTSYKRVLYPYEHAYKNVWMFGKVVQYTHFIRQIVRKNIIFCNRCDFGIFCYLYEDHGEYYCECDNGDACCTPVLAHFGMQCQWCDYSLCDACEHDEFDHDNVGFNVLLTAVVLMIDVNSNYEQFEQLLREFPDDDKHIPKLIDCIANRRTFESARGWWRNIYTLRTDDDRAQALYFLHLYKEAV